MYAMYKKRGSILATAMVAVICWIFIAQSFFITTSSQFKTIKSSRVALQAQQYAEISIDRLKNINYDELDSSGAHARQTITGISSDEWQDEVTINGEIAIPGSDDAKQRIATINVYKKGDTLPRYSVELPLSSQSGGSSVPIGTIWPYAGPLALIPEDWHLCDGTAGTPDLRGRFIAGYDPANPEYALKHLGGEATHTLTVAEMPSHAHPISSSSSYRLQMVIVNSEWSNLNGFYGNGYCVNTPTHTVTELSNIGLQASSTGGSRPHENRPPYIALYYIMKVQ